MFFEVNKIEVGEEEITAEVAFGVQNVADPLDYTTPFKIGDVVEIIMINGNGLVTARVKYIRLLQKNNNYVLFVTFEEYKWKVACDKIPELPPIEWKKFCDNLNEKKSSSEKVRILNVNLPEPWSWR